MKLTFPSRLFEPGPTRPPMPFTWHRFKKRIQIVFSTLSDWSIFIGVVLIGGLGSSWYMVNNGSPLTTRTIGPWTTWITEGRADADPYTRAHFVRAGTLNFSSEAITTYRAYTDSDGNRLHSSCEYQISGANLESGWWSITAFDRQGRLIPNAANRYTFTSDTAAVSPNNNVLIVLARDARPGNWLPTGGAGRLQVTLSMLTDKSSLSAIRGEETKVKLPEIKTIRCR